MIIISRHVFNFEGGEILANLSASWFVSYMYYQKIDNTHLSWEKYPERISIFNNSVHYHQKWLGYVLNMNVLQLNKNQIGLSGQEIKNMADKLAKIAQKEELWE